MAAGPGVPQFYSVQSQPGIQTAGQPYNTSYNYPSQTEGSISPPYDYVAERVRYRPEGPINVNAPGLGYQQANQWGGPSSLEQGQAAAYPPSQALTESPPVIPNPFPGYNASTQYGGMNGGMNGGMTRPTTGPRLPTTPQPGPVNIIVPQVSQGAQSMLPNQNAQSNMNFGRAPQGILPYQNTQIPMTSGQGMLPNQNPQFLTTSGQGLGQGLQQGMLPYQTTQYQGMPPYQNAQVPPTTGNYIRPRSSSFVYPNQTSYPSQYPPATYPNMPFAQSVTPPSQTIVIQQPRRHRHRHRHRHRSY